MDHCWNSVVYPRNKHNQNYPNHFSHCSCLYSQLITKGCDFILVLIIIIGGRLTFLPGASVEGADGLFDPSSDGPVAQLPALPDSEATTVTALRQDYNNLLAALRSAGFMASAPAAGGGDG